MFSLLEQNSGVTVKFKNSYVSYFPEHQGQILKVVCVLCVCVTETETWH